jgi:hypothetical protein
VEFSCTNLTTNSIPTITGKEPSEGLLIFKYMPSYELGKSICENDLLLLNKVGATSTVSQRGCAPVTTRSLSSQIWARNAYLRCIVLCHD